MIDILDLVKIIPTQVAVMMNEEMAEPVLRDIAEAARDKWMQLAGKKFKTTRADYVSGLQPVAFTPGQAVITLVGVLPNILEKGTGAKNLYDTLLGSNVPLVPLGSRGKHPAKDGGEYRAIPFRHGTPGSGGAAGMPMGGVSARLRETEAGTRIKELSKDIYKAAKKLEPSTTDPYNVGKWGDRLNTDKLKVPKLDPRHATDIYSGMAKMQKFYRSAVQSSYMTFRMISKGPDGQPRGGVIPGQGGRRRQPAKWLRSATKGANLAKEVSAYVTRIAPGAISQYVANL